MGPVGSFGCNNRVTLRKEVVGLFIEDSSKTSYSGVTQFLDMQQTFSPLPPHGGYPVIDTHVKLIVHTKRDLFFKEAFKRSNWAKYQPKLLKNKYENQ